LKGEEIESINIFRAKEHQELK
jgi:hypothetical protein